MKKAILILLNFLFLSFYSLRAQNDKPAYALFNSKGEKVVFGDILKEALESDIILFGELHNNPIVHWLQIELARDIYAQKKQNLVLGAEMFETDIQLVLDEFLAEKINEKSFRSEARSWPNYNTDYKPIVDFAKENKINLIATNTPKRYANLVYHKGLEELESLSKEAKKNLPPLPIKYDPSLKGYAEIQKATQGHGSDNLPKSQALKDATMAHFILKNMGKNNVFLHFNGTYHSNNYEGIYWYLKQEKPKLKIMTIASAEQKEIQGLSEENLNLADFIIVTPENMTKTH